MKFPFAQIKHRDRNPQNRHADDERRIDFSYSGIKTAVLRYVETHDMREAIDAAPASAERRETKSDARRLSWPPATSQTLDLVASFQRAVVNDLVSKTLTAAREYQRRHACWSREESPPTANCAQPSETGRDEEGVPVLFPSRKLSTDNAAMIAAAAYPRFLAGRICRCRIVGGSRIAAEVGSATTYPSFRSQWGGVEKPLFTPR